MLLLITDARLTGFELEHHIEHETFGGSCLLIVIRTAGSRCALLCNYSVHCWEVSLPATAGVDVLARLSSMSDRRHTHREAQAK